MAVPGGVGVRPGLDGAPVVARGDGDGVNAVHHALVVGGGAVGIGPSEPPSGGDAFSDLSAGSPFGVEVLRAQAHPGAGEAAVGEVREDPQAHTLAGDRLHQRRQTLHQGVDHVRAHGVDTVEVHVEHDVTLDGQAGLVVGDEAHVDAA